MCLVIVFSPTTLANTLVFCFVLFFSSFFVRYAEWDLLRDCLLLPGVCSSHDTLSLHTYTHTHTHTHTHLQYIPLPPTPHPVGTVVVCYLASRSSPTHTRAHTHSPLPRFSHSLSLPPSHTLWNGGHAVLTAPAPLWESFCLLLRAQRLELSAWRAFSRGLIGDTCMRRRWRSPVTPACGHSFLAFLFPVDVHVSLETVL